MHYDQLVDIKGLCCAAPVLKLTSKFRNYAVGETVLVVADKRSMLNDIPAYCSMKGYPLLKEETTEALFYFWIQKK